MIDEYYTWIFYRYHSDELASQSNKKIIVACDKFDDDWRSNNRDKYDNRCFLCGKHSSENVTKNGKQKELAVHHVDMNKDQRCNGHDWALVPLCMKHHNIFHTKIWQERIEYLLRSVW